MRQTTDAAKEHISRNPQAVVLVQLCNRRLLRLKAPVVQRIGEDRIQVSFGDRFQLAGQQLHDELGRDPRSLG